MSKGSKQRPTDHDSFANNFDKIFTSKSKGGSWVQVDGKLVPKEEYVPEPSAHYVMADIQPYKSMIDGQMITSRSQHRDHLKQHRMVEIGNEVNAHMSSKQPQIDNTIKRDIIDAYKRFSR